MEKSQLPPSYNEVYPSAPVEQSTTSWNPPNPAPLMQQGYQPVPVHQFPANEQQFIQQQPQPFHQHPQPIIVYNQHLSYGPDPVAITCPNCRNHIVTKLESVNSIFTHIAAGILCFMGCWLGCCLIPYCIDAGKNIDHTCPKCGAFLGQFRRI